MTVRLVLDWLFDLPAGMGAFFLAPATSDPAGAADGGALAWAGALPPQGRERDRRAARPTGPDQAPDASPKTIWSATMLQNLIFRAAA